MSEPTTPPRLLPLIENSPNDGLANLLTRLLIDDPALADDGARLAILIMTGIQAFLDSGGSYSAVEIYWEPVITARQMAKAYGEHTWKKAAEMAGACKATGDERGAAIYTRVAEMLAPADIKKNVDGGQ